MADGGASGQAPGVGGRGGDGMGADAEGLGKAAPGAQVAVQAGRPGEGGGQVPAFRVSGRAAKIDGGSGGKPWRRWPGWRW